MAFAIRWILVWVCWMIVACAMALIRCKCRTRRMLQRSHPRRRKCHPCRCLKRMFRHKRPRRRVRCLRNRTHRLGCRRIRNRPKVLIRCKCRIRRMLQRSHPRRRKCRLHPRRLGMLRHIRPRRRVRCLRNRTHRLGCRRIHIRTPRQGRCTHHMHPTRQRSHPRRRICHLHPHRPGNRHRIRPRHQAGCRHNRSRLQANRCIRIRTHRQDRHTHRIHRRTSMMLHR